MEKPIDFREDGNTTVMEIFVFFADQNRPKVAMVYHSRLGRVDSAYG